MCFRVDAVALGSSHQTLSSSFCPSLVCLRSCVLWSVVLTADSKRERMKERIKVREHRHPTHLCCFTSPIRYCTRCECVHCTHLAQLGMVASGHLTSGRPGEWTPNKRCSLGVQVLPAGARPSWAYFFVTAVPPSPVNLWPVSLDFL